MFIRQSVPSILHLSSFFFHILQRISQQKKGASESSHPSSHTHPSRALDIKDGHAGTVPLINHQNALPPLAGVPSSYSRLNGISNGSGNHTPPGSALLGVHTNGSSAGESGHLLPHLSSPSTSAFPYP